MLFPAPTITFRSPWRPKRSPRRTMKEPVRQNAGKGNPNYLRIENKSNMANDSCLICKLFSRADTP
jgi:hypothetical protein